MFLKSLRLENDAGIVRDIHFHHGLNLIVDETPSGAGQETGNNVGKTTVLMLIDFCLGANPKNIYTDTENKKNEHAVVKNFLIDTRMKVILTMTENLDDEVAKKIVIERNFLSRKQMIRCFNGENLTEDQMEEALTNSLFPGHYGKKPTFQQIISHNFRYKEPGVSNTLRTLNDFTRFDEYETLYLFLFGCQFERGDMKQKLLAQLRVENAFKSRLEAQQTRSAYEASLALLLKDIELLNDKKACFNLNPNFESDLTALDEVRYKIHVLTASIGRAKLRRSLIHEAIKDVESGLAQVDTEQLRALYSEVASKIANISIEFKQLVNFHNRMIEEKSRYIAKELPQLERELENNESELARLLDIERSHAARVAKNPSFQEMEAIAVELNDKHRLRGEYETVINQVHAVDTNIRSLNDAVGEINTDLFSDAFELSMREQINKFNLYFSAVSQELYGERYAIKVDPAISAKKERIYKFDSFNTNFSSGKKMGEITCFDIAYTLFADEEGIPCYHFLLNDKKELMHDNQLTHIARLIDRNKSHIQFVASILRDKLPVELNKETNFVLTLSQQDKLFRIES